MAMGYKKGQSLFRHRIRVLRLYDSPRIEPQYYSLEE